MANIRLSRPDYGLRPLVRVHTTLYVVPSSLGSGGSGRWRQVITSQGYEGAIDDLEHHSRPTKSSFSSAITKTRCWHHTIQGIHVAAWLFCGGRGAGAGTCTLCTDCTQGTLNSTTRRACAGLALVVWKNYLQPLPTSEHT